MYPRLEEISTDLDAIQLNRKPIAAFFLWVTNIGVLDGARWFDCQSDITHYQLSKLRDRIHLANPAPATVYLNALLSHICIDHCRVTELPGSEQGTKVASLCLLRVLSGVDPTSSVLDGICEHYVEVIPRMANFDGLHCYYAINAIHASLVTSQIRQFFEWVDYEPDFQEHIFFANTLVQVAHNGIRHGKVPRWLLRFAIHSLSQYPPPPISVTIDCLTIIMVDLGYDVSHAGTSYSLWRYVNLWQLRISLTVRVVND